MPAASAKGFLNIQAQLLLYEFYKDQHDDVVSGQTLSDLAKSVVEYAQNSSDPKVIKDIADKLVALGEKTKSKELYRTYVNKITGSEIKDEELGGIAKEFFSEGNLELSEAVYDKYIERIEKSLPKEEVISTLIKIAKMFSCGSTIDSTSIDHGIQIVVLDRGFVYVGYVKTDADWCHITQAKNIRKWGTTKGLGELVNGPLAETKVDDLGSLRAPLRAVISLICVDESKWKKIL